MRVIQNKIYSCLKTEPLEKLNNIIFLDIDGVIQPYNNQYRFEHNLNDLPEFLAAKFNDDIYKTIDKYDLGACFYDWNEIALGILKELLKQTKSYLVIHSGWKDVMSKEHLIALFKIYQLDEYIIDVVDKGDKVKVIKEYIQQHEIDKYLIIDDMHFELYFGQNFYLTNNYLNIKDYYYIYSYFKHDYNIVENEDRYCIYKDNKLVEDILKHHVNDNVDLLDISYLNQTLSNIDICVFVNELLKLNYKNKFICLLDTNKDKKDFLEKYIYKYCNYDLYFLDTLNKGYKFIDSYMEYEESIFNCIHTISTTK